MTTRFSELSTEAVFAWFYALAVVQPEAWADKFRSMQQHSEAAADRLGKKIVSATDKRRALFKGLNELAERQLIDVQRDGEGNHVPIAVHEDSLINDGSSLVLNEGE